MIRKPVTRGPSMRTLLEVLKASKDSVGIQPAVDVPQPYNPNTDTPTTGGGPVNEPDNHTAWVDCDGDTWVRADDMPGQYGTWWPCTDGPGWEPQVRDGVGQARTWDQVDGFHGPFTQADPDRTAQALERVRRTVPR